MTAGAAPWTTGAECGKVLPAFARALGELDDVTRARTAAEPGRRSYRYADLASVLEVVRPVLAADVFVMVLPCGKSAHLELGWAVGAGKRTAILLEDPVEPELMYRMVDHMARSIDELIEWIGGGS